MARSSSNSFAVQITPGTPPPAGVSPDGTTLNINSLAGATITDGTLAVWTKQLQTNGTAAQIGVAQNGVRRANSIDFLTIKAGLVYQKDTLAGTTGTGWERWDEAAKQWIEVPPLP